MTALSADQVAWFRLKRSGLVEPFSSPTDCARALIGIQAQLPPATGLALAVRCRGFGADAFARALTEDRTLVRFWGQRNTLHVFATGDWPLLHSAFGSLRSLMDRRLEREGLLDAFRRLVRRIERRLEAGAQLSHRDVKSKALERQDKWVVSYLVFMNLVRRGVACYGPGAGNETRFVHRRSWVPDLDWHPPPAKGAVAAMAQRYLAAYGPGTIQDFAFWFGVAAGSARRWIGRAGDRLIEVSVDGQPHWCAREDLASLNLPPPPRSRWPVRLLYRFDPLLLATKDKSWLIDQAHYKKIWRPSAHVAAAILAKGRIAGTWRYERKSRGLEILINPFSPLAKTELRKVEKEALRVAGFFGAPLARLDMGD